MARPPDAGRLPAGQLLGAMEARKEAVLRDRYVCAWLEKNEAVVFGFAGDGKVDETVTQPVPMLLSPHSDDLFLGDKPIGGMETIRKCFDLPDYALTGSVLRGIEVTFTDMEGVTQSDGRYKPFSKEVKEALKGASSIIGELIAKVSGSPGVSMVVVVDELLLRDSGLAVDIFESFSNLKVRRFNTVDSFARFVGSENMRNVLSKQRSTSAADEEKTADDSGTDEDMQIDDFIDGTDTKMSSTEEVSDSIRQGGRSEVRSEVSDSIRQGGRSSGLSGVFLASSIDMDTEREVTMCRIWCSGMSTTLSGASLASFKEQVVACGKRYPLDVIHMASFSEHSQVPSWATTDVEIIFDMGPRLAEKEAAGLQLMGARLVVLSLCKGSAFAAPLLDAGAHCVVATSTLVDSALCLAFMPVFYMMLSLSQSVGDSVRKTKELLLRKYGDTILPVLSGFNCYGNAGLVLVERTKWQLNTSPASATRMPMKRNVGTKRRTQTHDDAVSEETKRQKANDGSAQQPTKLRDRLQHLFRSGLGFFVWRDAVAGEDAPEPDAKPHEVKPVVAGRCLNYKCLACGCYYIANERDSYEALRAQGRDQAWGDLRSNVQRGYKQNGLSTKLHVAEIADEPAAFPSYAVYYDDTIDETQALELQSKCPVPLIIAKLGTKPTLPKFSDLVNSCSFR